MPTPTRRTPQQARAALRLNVEAQPRCRYTGTPLTPQNAVAVLVPARSATGGAGGVAVMHASHWDRRRDQVLDHFTHGVEVLDGRQLFAA